MNTRPHFNILAALAIIGAVILALAGAGSADDQLAIAMLGLAGTLAGRGSTGAAA